MIGTVEIERSQKERWMSGRLAPEWARRFPPLFDADDLALAECPQGREGYHFIESRRVPVGRDHRSALPAGGRRLDTPTVAAGRATSALKARRTLAHFDAIPTRDSSSRQLNGRTLSFGPEPRIRMKTSRAGCENSSWRG